VFPEVFSLKGGFDAIVGNPPFLGGTKISGALGKAYQQFLGDVIAGKAGNRCDLVGYFLLRAHEALNVDGQAGLVTTNTISQGDTREVGLDQLLRAGVGIRRATKSAPWPSRSAVLEYSSVWTSQAGVPQVYGSVLDGMVVPSGISSSLSPKSREESWVERLTGHSGRSFTGVKITGFGFTMPQSEARKWIADDPRYAEVLFPYLGGQDVNTDPLHGTDRWIINFRDWPLAKAQQYPNAYRKVLRDVKPECESKDPKTYAGLMDHWWQYWRPRTEMMKALRPLESCIVITLVSKVVMPVMVPANQVFSQKLGVFASESPVLLALLSSAPHYWWALDRSSTLKTDLSYNTTDVFETLVHCSPADALEAAGKRLDVYRRELMERRNMGLTSTYNLLHDPECQDPDIRELRAIHEQIDRATIAAYGWSDLLDGSGKTPPIDPTHETFPLDHGFHETDQGPRYTIGLLARTEILDRLRQLNHQAYADEVHLGLHKGVTEKKAREKHPDLPPPSPEAIRKRKEQIAARGGSDFGEGAEGALF
jgi:hypothetical protein